MTTTPPVPTTPAGLAIAIATPLIAELTEWLEGRADEPPALKHLGVSQLVLADYRQRALAAKSLRRD